MVAKINARGVFQKAVVVNLEKTLQNKFYEAEENYKHTIQTLTEENTFLRYNGHIQKHMATIV